MQRKRKKKQVRASFVSNIKINNKVIIIFILLGLCSAVLGYGLYHVVNELISDNSKENEKMISVTAEEFVNTEIENMVSVARTVYTNDSLYDFLNTRYQSTVDYFEKYYDFAQSRFLVITETSAVKQFSIYTANSTVMNGGIIGKIDSVSNEDWYSRFRELDRDMIIYCSSDQKNLSLIRKLDYKKVNTGEAILKLDFNPANLQTTFMNMYFDGRVYVSCGDTLLYSNQKELSMPDRNLISNFYKRSRNFYTCDIDYYVGANQKSAVSLFSIPFVAPILGILAVSFLLSIAILTDFKNRTLEVCRICVEKRRASADRHKINFGADEIGRLYRDVNNTLVDLNRLADEKNNLKRFINEYKLKTNDVILAALNFETQRHFDIASAEEVSRAVSLDEELLNMSRMLDRLKEQEYFKYSLLSDTTSEVKNVIPYSLSAVALHVAGYNGTGPEIEIDVRERDGCYSVRYYKAGTPISSADVLRLRAIFEPESAKSLPSFEAEDEFNAYVRLGRYYLDNITLNINSKEELDFEFIITSRSE